MACLQSFKKMQVFCLLFLLFASATLSAQQVALYKTIQVGDDLGWDYLAIDSVNRNLFCSHGNRVLVVDMEKDAVVATIPNTSGVHGIAFDYELGRGFISNGKANSVTVFNLKNFSIIDTLAVTGVNPDAILFDDFSKKIFAFNGKTDNVTVIDPSSLQVISTLSLPGKPEFAVSDLKGIVYVNLEDKNMVAAIDTKNFSLLHTWPVLPGEEPSGLAIDRKNQLLFSVCSNNKLTIFDIKKQKVINSVLIGGRPDAVVYDPSSQKIYSSNGEGNVTIIKQETPASYKILQVLETRKGCKTLAFDSQSKKLYLPAALFEGETRKIEPGSFNILVFK